MAKYNSTENRGGGGRATLKVRAKGTGKNGMFGGMRGGGMKKGGSYKRGGSGGGRIGKK